MERSNLCRAHESHFLFMFDAMAFEGIEIFDFSTRFVAHSTHIKAFLLPYILGVATFVVLRR